MGAGVAVGLGAISFFGVRQLYRILFGTFVDEEDDDPK